jgi:hypothetical protein
MVKEFNEGYYQEFEIGDEPNKKSNGMTYIKE